MQPSKRSWATVQQKAFRFLCLGMVAALLAGALFAAQPNGSALAATGAVCTSVSSLDLTPPPLNWNSAASWSCGHVPTSADDVVIANGREVDLFSVQSVHSLTIGGASDIGILVFTSAVPLTISGDLTILAGGLLDPGGTEATGGTILLVGAGNQTISSVDNAVDFWNLKKFSSAAGQTLFFNTGSKEIHILNNLTLKGTPANHLLLRSTSTGTMWNISTEGARDLNWLDVEDSNNTSLAPFSLVNWIDTGNNTGWAKDTDADSSVAIAAITNPSFGGRPVTLTFRVYPATAAGNVTFYEGLNAVSGCENLLLTDGAAGCTITHLSVGSHSIFAVFTSANQSFSDSTANVLLQAMNLAYYLPIGKN